MKRIVLALVAAAALAAPASALAGNVVVKVERGSHLVAVASAKHVMLVHTRAASTLRVGERIAMRSHKLRNGTFAASSVRVLGRAKHVAFRGLLLSRERSNHTITVSAGGAPVTVTSTSTPPSAQPGSEVEVEADVEDNGDLNANDVNVVSATAPGGSLEGHLLAIGTSSITVGSEHATLVINVPSGFNLSTFKVGDEVLAVFTQQTDGTLLLTSLTGDENAVQANENDDNQGDTNSGDDGGGGDSNGGSGDNGGNGGHD
jgi:uncharacterized membrane protein YgcG